MAGNTRSISRRTRAAMRAVVFTRDGHACRRCGWSPKGAPLLVSETITKRNGRMGYRGLELDHVVPFAHGGVFTADNLQTLCNTCNARKGTNA